MLSLLMKLNEEVTMLNEEKVVSYLKAQFSPYPREIIGIGDDAAIFPLNETKSYVVTKDLLIEDRHFSMKYFDPASLAQKTLHANLSDIAAMGAEANFVLLGMAIPSTFSSRFVDRFLHDFAENCKEHSIQLIGGDTTASNGKLFISLTAIGTCANDHFKFRHTAQAGDAICVAGEIGHAHAGLMALERDVSGLESIKAKALRPKARVKEGIWFGARDEITAMMDISDGLYIDLKRLCASSKVGAEILLQNLVPSKELSQTCSTLELDPLECMMIGGEDYGLIITIKPQFAEDVISAFEHAFGYKLTQIGTIIQTGPLKIINKGEEVPFTYRSFSHFGEHDAL